MAKNEGDKDKLKAILESLPPPGAEPPVAAQHNLEECAIAMLDWLGFQDPLWAERLKVLTDERGWPPLEVCGALIAYPLDHSLHMEIQRSPLIENVGDYRGASRTGPRKLTCLQCGTEFEMKYAGQRALCSNRCARGYDSAQKTLQA